MSLQVVSEKYSDVTCRCGVARFSAIARGDGQAGTIEVVCTECHRTLVKLELSDTSAYRGWLSAGQA